jgi:hypothetical protein
LPVVGTRADDFGKVEIPTPGIQPIRFTLDPAQKALDRMAREENELRTSVVALEARAEGIAFARRLLLAEIGAKSP